MKLIISLFNTILEVCGCSYTFLKFPSRHTLGYCNIDFFIFCHHLCIMRLKISKFEGGQNTAEKCLIGNNKKNFYDIG